MAKFEKLMAEFEKLMAKLMAKNREINGKS
jgi:hypothetical protein